MKGGARSPSALGRTAFGPERPLGPARSEIALHPWKWPIYYVVLVVATALAYFPALHGSLLWNDSDYVTKPALRSLSGLRRIWFEVGATEQYYPAIHSAFWLQHRLWGDSALGYHLANLIFHIAAAGLFTAVLRRLSAPGAGWAGMLFALHPICVESVAWIAEEKNTLSLLFYLLAAFAYLRFDERRSWAAYAVSSVCFLAAIFSKSLTATLPAALLVVFWWRRGTLAWRKDVVPLLPWFLAGGAVGIFTAWVERHYVGAEGSAFALDGISRVLLAGRIVAFYLAKLVWPTHLVFMYAHWSPDYRVWWQDLFPVGAVLVAIALWRLRHWSRAPLAAYLFFVGSLFPTLGFFNVYGFAFSYVADHWQYLPSLGWFGLLGGARSPGALGKVGVRARTRYGPARPEIALHLLFTTILVVLGVLTWRQCRMYRDVETLYRVTIDRNPDAWLAQSNLGEMLAERHDWDGAIEHYQAAARLVPGYPEIHSNLGDAWLGKGRLQDAAGEYVAALRLNPAYTPAALKLAGLLSQVGQFNNAATVLQQALAARPNFPETEYALGNALANSNRVEEAVAHYRAAIRLRPDFPEAHANLGLALASGGHWAEATAELTEALRLRPAYPEAQAYLGQVLAQTGRWQEAIVHYREALRLAPHNAAVRYQLDLALSAARREGLSVPSP